MLFGLTNYSLFKNHDPTAGLPSLQRNVSVLFSWIDVALIS
jgi:hypothetical protein